MNVRTYVDKSVHLYSMDLCSKYYTGRSNDICVAGTWELEHWVGWGQQPLYFSTNI